MNLKTDRRRQIRINGEPVTVLDYGSMYTRLAYADIKATAPEGERNAVPGLEGYRSGVKMAMNCLLFVVCGWNATSAYSALHPNGLFWPDRSLFGEDAWRMYATCNSPFLGKR